MSGRVPSEAAAAGSVEPLISAPFLMSNFTGSGFSERAPPPGCMCVGVFESISCLEVKPKDICFPDFLLCFSYYDKLAGIKEKKKKRSKLIMCSPHLQDFKFRFVI